MKSHKNIFLFYLLILVGSCFLSCDKIEGPFKEKALIDNVSCPPGIFGSQSVVKKVLLEEFTGHTCGNCPASHEISASLKQLYGNKLIILSVHAGSFAMPKNYTNGSYSYDFRSSCGNDIDNTFGNDAAGLPNGLIDRKTVNGNAIIRPTAWATEVQKSLSNTAIAGLQIATNYETSDNKLCTSIQTEFVNNVEGTYKLLVYLTEDSIINWQKDYRKTPENIPDFMHRHVLRASINSSFGENIARGQIQSGAKIVRNFKTILNPTYKANHCSVVAFLVDSASAEVMQVEEKRILE